MRYAIMAFEDAEAFAARTDPTRREAFWADMGYYIRAIRESGAFLGGAGLLPPESATTIRYESDERLVQDGPYADIKEHLGGLFIIDAPDLDAALAWAAKFPRQRGRVVEVRPCLPE